MPGMLLLGFVDADDGSDDPDDADEASNACGFAAS